MSDKITIDQAIDIFNEMKEQTSFDIIETLTKIDIFNDISTFKDVSFDPCVGTSIQNGNYEQAIISMVKGFYPKARYGFDYNPAIQPDKNGRERCAQAWVKMDTIDWSISHKFVSIAMIVALLHVIRDIKTPATEAQKRVDSKIEKLKSK